MCILRYITYCLLFHFFICRTEGLEWMISEVPLCIHPTWFFGSCWYYFLNSSKQQDQQIWNPSWSKSLRLVGNVVVKFQCNNKSISNCYFAVFKMQPFISTEWYRALFLGKQSKKEWLREKSSRKDKQSQGEVQRWLIKLTHIKNQIDVRIQANIY